MMGNIVYYHYQAATWNKMDKADILELAVQHMQQMSAEHTRNKLARAHHADDARHTQHPVYSECETQRNRQHTSSSLPSSPSASSPCSSRSSTPEYANDTFLPVSVVYRPVATLVTPSIVQVSQATPLIDESMWRPW